MPDFKDIKQITHGANYCVDVSFQYLPSYLIWSVEMGFDSYPDFQRPHVWTVLQKQRYIEYILRGGKSGRDIYTNCPNWHHGQVGPGYEGGWYVLVDGRQRLEAVISFFSNEFKVFDHYYSEYTGSMRHSGFKWHVNDLATYDECLDWYIDLNTGGTVHSDEEIGRVRALKNSGTTYTQPSMEKIKENIGFDKEIFKVTVEKEELRKIEAEASPKVAAPKKRTKK